MNVKVMLLMFLTDVIMEAVELVHPDRSHPPVVATHGGFVV